MDPMQGVVSALLLLLFVPDADPNAPRLHLPDGPAGLAPLQRVRPAHRVLHLLEDGQPELVSIT